jgi:hypothetical protein
VACQQQHQDAVGPGAALSRNHKGRSPDLSPVKVRFTRTASASHLAPSSPILLPRSLCHGSDHGGTRPEENEAATGGTKVNAQTEAAYETSRRVSLLRSMRPMCSAMLSSTSLLRILPGFKSQESGRKWGCLAALWSRWCLALTANA